MGGPVGSAARSWRQDGNECKGVGACPCDDTRVVDHGRRMLQEADPVAARRSGRSLDRLALMGAKRSKTTVASVRTEVGPEDESKRT